MILILLYTNPAFRYRPSTPRLYIGLVLVMLSPALVAETVRRGSNPLINGPESVAVTGDALIHTAQILATDASGNLVGDGVKAQTDQVLDNLHAALTVADSGLLSVIKLNLYVHPGGFVAPVIEAVKERFPGDARPAICVVESALPHPKALVAADAVATRSDNPTQERVVLYPGQDTEKAASAALLPPGPRVYVSGQAAREADLRQSTGAALNLLRKNLEFLGLHPSDIVQVKAFFKPMSAASLVSEPIHGFFGGKTPPLVFVEWSNAEPIEIELIAAGPRNNYSSDPLQYLTPPGERVSPVFCRIVRVDHPTTIYLSAVYGRGDGGAEQIRDAFNLLGGAAARAGADLRHLVKATYYVTTDEVGQQITDVRRGLYDPSRPPAASKATVSGAGADASLFAMDMIAVPAVRATDH